MKKPASTSPDALQRLPEHAPPSSKIHGCCLFESTQASVWLRPLQDDNSASISR